MTMLLSAVAGQGGVKVPGAPGTLSLSNGSTSGTMINLSWSAPSDDGGGTFSGYKIQRSTNSGVSWSDLVADTSSTGTTYTNTGLTRLTRYDYRVAAINEKGTGAYGNEPNHTTTAEVPGAPGTLSLSAGSTATTEIDLSWSAPSDTGGATVTGYRIKKDGSVLVADTSSTGTTYTATGLTQNTSYNFNVAAINSIGTGADGNTPSLSTAEAPMVATGGTITTHGIYKVHTFTASGDFTVTSNPNSKVASVLLVGGGGSDGVNNTTASNFATGGSGGGGVRTTTITATQVVTIGAGAAAGGNDGGTTTCSVSVLGGGGVAKAGDAATNAPSGGGGGSGGSETNTSGYAPGAGSTYGYIGGAAQDGTGTPAYATNISAGGGGGAGGAGSPGTLAHPVPSGGDGGAGLGNDYRTGSTVLYGPGGGGAGSRTDGSGITYGGDSGQGAFGTWDGRGGFRYGNGSSGRAQDGAANTGMGAGGSAYQSSYMGQAGGSGIVVIRYVA